MNHYVKNIKRIFLGKKGIIFLPFIVIFLCFFKAKEISVCTNLQDYFTDENVISNEIYLDSLELFVIMGGEGNATDYFLYNGFRIYCATTKPFKNLIDANKVWDGKYEGNALFYLRPYITDDVFLFRVRKFFNSFYLIKKNENLTDVTYWFFATQGCNKSFAQQKFE